MRSLYTGFLNRHQKLLDKRSLKISTCHFFCILWHWYFHLVSSKSIFSFQVTVPTGVKVIMERTYRGIDVALYTPRAKHSQNESGLCTYSGNNTDITHLAWKYRSVLMIGRNGWLHNWYHLCSLVFFSEHVGPVYETHMWWHQTQSFPIDPLRFWIYLFTLSRFLIANLLCAGKFVP